MLCPQHGDGDGQGNGKFGFCFGRAERVHVAGCRLKDGRSLALFSSFLQSPPCRPANSPIAFIFISCKTIFMQTNDMRHYQGWVIACKDLGWFSHRNNYLCRLLVKALPVGLAQRHANSGKMTLKKKKRKRKRKVLIRSARKKVSVAHLEAVLSLEIYFIL